MYSDIPTTTFMLQPGQTYTLRLQTSSVLGKPLESTIIEKLRTDPYLTAAATIAGVRNPLFTRDFYITFNMNTPYNYGTFTSMILDDMKNIGWEMSIVDFQVGSQADLPTLIPGVGISVSDTFSAVKWVAIAAVMGVSLIYLGPLLRGRKHEIS